MNLKLKYIKFEKIDKTRWDTLVSNATNSDVFCFSWYLDAFCEWDAIILGDYCGAIALPRAKKLIFKSLYQPNFVQKCIWFGQSLSVQSEEHLILLITTHFSIIHFNTNLNIGHSTERTNLVLNLNDGIDSVRANYSRSLKRNLKKASNSIVVSSETNCNEVINLYKKVWGGLNHQLNDSHYDVLLRLAQDRPKNFVCMSASVQSECLAGILLVKGKNRLHYILGANSANGKKENALSYLLDAAFKDFASTGYIFDFEGSSIPNVKSYYSSFGASDEPFYEVDLSNRLISECKTIYKRLFKS